MPDTLLDTPPRLIGIDGEVIRALTLRDKLADLFPKPQGHVPTMGSFVRAAATGNWKRAGIPAVDRAIGETGDVVFPVPAAMSAQWLDALRPQSVVFQAGAITIPMTSMTQTVVSVTSDPVPLRWRKEHRVIPEASFNVGPITMRARLCGTLIRTSIELLEDSPIAETVIESLLQSAAAVEIDRVMLMGAGNTAGDLDEPTGLYYWPGRPGDIPWDFPFHWDAPLNGMGQVWAAHATPTAMIGATQLAVAAAQAKTGLAGDRTPLAEPAMIAALPKFYTSALNNNPYAYIGDWKWLAWGLRLGFTIEVSREASDAFQKAQAIIRLIFRGDVCVLRPAAFAVISYS